MPNKRGVVTISFKTMTMMMVMNLMMISMTFKCAILMKYHNEELPSKINKIIFSRLLFCQLIYKFTRRRK